MDSHTLFERAVKVLPGGVNSPVRACKNVGCEPRFIEKADGSHICDVEGRSYIDYVGSWGPMILGHNFPPVAEAVRQAVGNGLSFGAPCQAEVDIAELMVQMVPGLEMVRMVNSGTEAVMSALRVARGVTGRTKIIKFAGCYHGHSDSMLVKAGSGALTGGSPDSKGVTASTAGDTLTAQYNDLDSVAALLEANPGQVAAVIVEPVAANMGVIPPQKGFLTGRSRSPEDVQRQAQHQHTPQQHAGAFQGIVLRRFRLLGLLHQVFLVHVDAVELPARPQQQPDTEKNQTP